MQRLTKRLISGAANLVNYETAADEYERSIYRQRAIESLADYEDILDGITLDRLRELVAAEVEGRCVVLPYPIGSKAYHVERDGVLKDKVMEINVNGYSECPWQGRINEGKDGRFIICHNSYNEPHAYQTRDVYATRAEAEKGEQK